MVCKHTPEATQPACPLCSPREERVVWRDDTLRVILADEPDYVGFTRVIVNAHVAEMTNLRPRERNELMRKVYAVETVLRQVLAPDKINLAGLGNMVPHLHWHVTPRFHDDPTWPDAIWAPAKRPRPVRCFNSEDYATRLRKALE